MDDARPPLPYKNQENSWFDPKTILWWVLNVFCTHHLRIEGDVDAIIFLGKCSAHDISDEEKSKLPKRLFISLLPPNVNNTYQPANMVMISSIKVGYKVSLFSSSYLFLILKEDN